MSSCRISPISQKLNSTTSANTMQLQLRRSISVENENGAATLAFLAALVKKSSCTSIKQNGMIEVDAAKTFSNLLLNSSSTSTDCANVPNVNHTETLVLSSATQSSVAAITATSVITSSTNNNNTAKSSSISQNLHHQIPSDILDDLASRFIINTPVDERQNFIRICFQIELAHWFYLDFFCGNEEKKLIPCGLKQFASHLFQHIPFLCNYLTEVDKILEDWKEYKLSVPTYGAILVSEDLKNVLLVQSYWAKSSWGFPKGKINEHESPVHCATREVYEETGFDITNMIVPDHYIECVINYQYTRLYIVRNVPTSTSFLPRTRKEIKCCEWFPLDSLPTTKNDTNCKSQLGVNANSFFMIIPFMKRLKKWISDNRSGIERKYSSSSPITTFNNNNGCSNYYTNNTSGSYNYNATNNGLVKSYSSIKKFNLDAKKENCTNNTNCNNQLKGTINENSDNIYNGNKNNDIHNNNENNDENNNNDNKNNNKNVKNDNDNSYNNKNYSNNNDININNNYNNDSSKNITCNNGNNNKNMKNNKNKNNNNNQKNKRQRHKSMGDIDGINLKLNFIKNNSNNNGCNNVERLQHQQQSCGYDKINSTNSTSKNNSSKDSDGRKRFFEDNSKYSSNKYGNSKRQLFSCISIDGSTNSDKNTINNNININSNSSKKDKDKILQISNNINNNNINNNNNFNKNGGNNNNNNNNSCNNISNNNSSNNNNSNNTVRLRTKSLGQHSNIQSTISSNGVQRKNSNENKDGGNMRKKSHNLQQQQHQTQQQEQEPQQKLIEQKSSRGQIIQQQNHKENINNNKNNNNNMIIDSKIINNHHNFLINSCTNQQRQFMKLKQQHEELKAEQEKNQLNSQHIVADNIKFNPNIDSWTNFSFTKNFIANVFC